MREVMVVALRLVWCVVRSTLREHIGASYLALPSYESLGAVIVCTVNVCFSLVEITCELPQSVSLDRASSHASNHLHLQPPRKRAAQHCVSHVAFMAHSHSAYALLSHLCRVSSCVDVVLCIAVTCPHQHQYLLIASLQTFAHRAVYT